MGRLQLTSPRVVQELLLRHGLKPSKHFGQNFLIDENILRQIVAAAQVGSTDLVLEIGPGVGALTQALAQVAGRVVAVEIDAGLFPLLEEVLAPYDNVELLCGDFLKLDQDKLFTRGQSLKVVANLPYYITSPILMALLEGPLHLDCIVVMVQKEVAQRLVAQPGTKAYGVLSVATQYYAVPEIVKVVPPTVFIPRPAVESAVVRLMIHRKPPVDVGDKRVFFRVVRGAFGQRRKTLGNSLATEFADVFSKEQIANFLITADIAPQRRGETLALEEFARLARIFMKGK